MVEKLKVHFELVEAGGAGYKILCVVLGLVDIYITSKPSTYKWDTCAGTYVYVRKCRSVCIATFLCYFSSYLFIPFSLRTLLKFSVKLHRSRRCAAFRCIFKPTIAQKPIWVLSICHNYEKLARPFFIILVFVYRSRVTQKHGGKYCRIYSTYQRVEL